MSSTFFDPVPPAIAAIDRENNDVLRWLREYLEDQGFLDTTGGIGSYGLRVDFANPGDEAAIRAAVEAWSASPSQRDVIERQIMQDAKTAIVAIKNKGPANWTTQDKIILAMALSIKNLKESAV